ncbi:hypothetical protein HPB48_005764 [Haemaphysalis longicornis]|uniref:Uncharacterized protein n=1 Tax=Haemaphysalis longicornis TaxID=44386 RepID=A0A9J6GVI8_HAELO|nr:hypothetical protein HPB48_005764 [Haemaphysalis longicornis]
MPRSCSTNCGVETSTSTRYLTTHGGLEGVARRTPYLPEVQVSRYYRSQTNEGRTDCFHISADTRPMANEAVAYLTLESENGTRSTTLVSEQRVAPGEEITLARLELMACLFAGRLCGYILENLKQQQSNVYLRTDSTTALYWIHEDVGRWKQFARN